MTDSENIIENILNHGDMLIRRCGDGYMVYNLNDLDKNFDGGGVNVGVLNTAYFDHQNVNDMLHFLVSEMETCYDLPSIKLERSGHGDAKE